MTDAGDPARVFLDAFSDIEAYVRRATGADQGERFATLVTQLASRDRLVREHQVSLQAFASLRNAIQHSKYRSGRPIATPHPDVVQAITAVRDQLPRPPRIDSFVQGRGPVETERPSTGVWQALRSMTERDFSQVLVYGDAGYVGLLTTNAVARWLASQVDATGALMVEEAPVEEVLTSAEPHEVAKFVARTATVTDVIDLLSGGSGGRLAPVAVVVTQNGKRAEKPLGIVVAHDLLDLLACIAVAV